MGVAIGAVALSAPEARAACIGGDSVCTTFDPTTVSNPARGGFTGNGNTTLVYQKVKVLLTFTGSALPVTFTNITLSGQGITSVLNFGSLTATISGQEEETGYLSLNTFVAGSDLNFSSNTLSFTIPSGVSIGSTINASFVYFANSSNINGPLAQFTTTAATSSSVPGPLPLLGAGAAFGFSRTLRKRIKAADQA